MWPWPRHVYADLLDRLMALGAAETVFDIDFSSASADAEDKSLETSLQAAGGYAALAGFQQFSPVSGKLEVTLPLARFRAVADSAVVNVTGEPDGVVRRYPGRHDRRRHTTQYPSLAEALSGQQLPGEQSFFIDYGIDASAIDRISVADVLAGTVDAKRIAGRQVVIAASAQELRDIFTVPRFGTLPGGMLQIMGAETLKQHRALHSGGFAVPALIIAGLGLLYVVPPARPALAFEIAAGFALLLVVEGSLRYAAQADGG